MLRILHAIDHAAVRMERHQQVVNLAAQVHNRGNDDVFVAAQTNLELSVRHGADGFHNDFIRIVMADLQRVQRDGRLAECIAVVVQTILPFIAFILHPDG